MANPKGGHYGTREVFLTVAMLVAVILAFIYFASGSLIQRDKRLEGSPAPEIEFELPSGRQQVRLSKLKGTVVLLNFWASWCTPCIEEMPALKMLEAHFKGKGFILLAFNIEDESENIRGRLGGTNYPDNLIFNFRKEFLRPYDLKAIPISVLIDSGGMVRQVYSGPRNWMDINIIREIDRLLR